MSVFKKKPLTETKCEGDLHYSLCGHILQAMSIPNATNKSNRWTLSEVQFLADTWNEPLYSVADALGRTYYATALARMRLKQGTLVV